MFIRESKIENPCGDEFYTKKMKILADYIPEINKLRNFNAILGCSEALNCRIFYAENATYSQRLMHYKKCDEYYGARYFDHMTNGFGHLSFYRAYLCEFIKSFESFLISEDMNLEVNMTQTGEFYVSKTGKRNYKMNIQEKFLFEYCCYIEINRFWNDFAGHCSLVIPEYPLLVFGLAENMQETMIPVLNSIKSNRIYGQEIIFCD